MMPRMKTCTNRTFENDDSRCNDCTFMTSLVPEQLISEFQILQANETTLCSTRYCRLIKLEYIDETMKISRNEYQRVENKIKNLVAMLYNNAIVNYKRCIL